jgi:branched-subunit amino acid ABC-type transport system permease component
VIAFGLLGAMLVLWLLDLRHDLWEKLVVLAFLAAAAGVGASAIALREGRLRTRARRGLVLSLAAAGLALAIEPLLVWVKDWP